MTLRADLRFHVYKDYTPTFERLERAECDTSKQNCASREDSNLKVCHSLSLNDVKHRMIDRNEIWVHMCRAWSLHLQNVLLELLQTLCAVTVVVCSGNDNRQTWIQRFLGQHCGTKRRQPTSWPKYLRTSGKPCSSLSISK